MSGFICNDCKFIGNDPETHRYVDKVDEFGCVDTFYESCPDCSSENLSDCDVCETCGSEESEPGFDLCKTCLIIHEAEAEDFKRDQQVEIRLLTQDAKT